jgi:hypothetical protein
MKFSTILILVLLGITFIPINTKINNLVDSFDFDHPKNEGYIAYIVNSQTEIPQPDNVSECDCNGSKEMIHGDGHKTPCQCFNTGDGTCKCKKKVTNYTSSLEDKFKSKQIVMLSSYSCEPCNKFKQVEVPKLEAVTWKVGTESDCHLKIINVEDDIEFYKKYGKGRPFPTFILFEKEKETKSIIGYTSATGVCDLWNK